MSQEEALFEGSYFARIDYSQRVFEPTLGDKLTRGVFNDLGDKLRKSYLDNRLHPDLFGAPLAPLGLEDPHELNSAMLGKYEYIKVSPEQDLDGPGIRKQGYLLKDPETRIYFNSNQPRPLKERSFENDLKLGLQVTIKEPETILSPAIVTTGQIILDKCGDSKKLVNASRGFSRFAGNLNHKIANLIPEEYRFGDLYGPINIQVVEVPQEYLNNFSLKNLRLIYNLCPKKAPRFTGFAQPSPDERLTSVDNFGINYGYDGTERYTVLATKKGMGYSVINAMIEHKI